MASPQIETLPNGLTLAVEEQGWNPGVALQLLVPMGATTDPDGLEGATSVLEGWLWKGAGNRDARAFAEALDDLGVRHGSGSGLEYTTFAAQFLADKLDAVLELYSDLLLRPQLPDEGLEPVRQVALQELSSIEDQPSKKMFTRLRRGVFLSNHGRSPAGTREGLEAITPERLRQDFSERFGAKGAILALVGGVSFQSVREAVLNALGGWR
ncbi:MAG: peptidase M16, partial [Meiothermus sp.]